MFKRLNLNSLIVASFLAVVAFSLIFLAVTSKSNKKPPVVPNTGVVEEADDNTEEDADNDDKDQDND